MNPEQLSGHKDTPRDLAALASAQRLLRAYLEEDAASLLGTLRGYVLRMGLATGAEVQEVALEIFQESVAEALACADRLGQQTAPRAWLLGIAVNMLKRRKVARAKQFQREASFGDIARLYPDLSDGTTVLDALLPPVTTGPAQIVEAREEAAALLALVSSEDQRILRLAVLEGHQHTSLARELGTTPGAARVRLHRALSRLRTAWQNQQQKLQKGTRSV